ncbi:olfactory receptor 10J4-like [Dromiciops gliroides]|uniref:olfactory receptor 10J4-like n=1 Tax=Dromiciops gliroides TaxID=33562 RepID=UPI001CC7AD06|nr:olfactory receptor 10J4-like [Dromiciops gliroides]
MKTKNHSEVSEFVFQGFSNFQEHQITLFVVFLALYILTLAGNVIIVTIIRIDRHLHTPMYLFLSILSTSETFYSLVIIPRMLSSLVGLSQSISFTGCATQMFFFLGFAITNCLLLAVMGYDRYVAICNPLRYSVIMNWRVCTLLASSVGITGFSLSLVQAVAIFRLPMPRANFTTVSEFTLDGFSSFGWKHRFLLFVIFLTLYLLTLASNALILTLIYLNRQLHTPMYFFLSVLSISETCYTVAIIPRMLTGLLFPYHPITIPACATQLFFYLTFGVNNCFLLTAMGYDRYVAICNPLRYTVIMGKTTCAQLACGSWSMGLGTAIIQVPSVFSLPFCDVSTISHFFCDIRPLLKLACADTTIKELVTLLISLGVIVLPMVLVFISYVLIFSTILKIASVEGRRKAFATCASHLTVVIVHYGCTSFVYLKPKSQNSLEDRLISVTYTVITPLLNPVVYSLRNKEIKDALRKALGWKLLS